jgi:predicted ferric reductase
LGLFTPSAGRTILLGVAAFASLTVAVALTLYARLGHEVFIWVQRSFGIIFGIGAFHFLVIEGAKTSQPLIKTYLIAVTVAGVLAFAYRSLFGDVLVRRYEYVVSEAHELDPEVMEIAMDPVGPAIKPQPGQFVYATFYSDEFDSQFHPVTVAATGESATIVLRPGDVKNQFHPFSVTSTPDDRSLRLVVKAVGGFTRALHRLKPGAVARIEGPYGEFSYLRLQHPRQVWVAGGIGITPFLSMARSLPAGGEHEITLFYGVKTRKEAFFAPELQALSERVEGFSVVVVPEDEEGFITTDRILTSQDLTSIDVMICGPPAMVAALRTSLSAAGVPPRNVHGERFGFGPRG